MKRLDELDQAELLNVMINNFRVTLSTPCYCVMCEDCPDEYLAFGYICSNCHEDEEE
jgi:hypothetical protein